MGLLALQHVESSGLGIEHLSSALAAGLLSTAAGKSHIVIIFKAISIPYISSSFSFFGHTLGHMGS